MIIDMIVLMMIIEMAKSNKVWYKDDNITVILKINTDHPDQKEHTGLQQRGEGLLLLHDHSTRGNNWGKSPFMLQVIRHLTLS